MHTYGKNIYILYNTKRDLLKSFLLTLDPWLNSESSINSFIFQKCPVHIPACKCAAHPHLKNTSVSILCTFIHILLFHFIRYVAIFLSHVSNRMGDLTHSLLAHLIFHQIEGPDIGLFLAYSWGRGLHWFAKIHFHFLTGYRVTLHFPKLSADNRTSGTAFLLMEYNDTVCVTSETRLSGCVHACSDLSPPSAPAAKWLWCWSCFNHGGYGHARKWESRIVEGNGSLNDHEE